MTNAVVIGLCVVVALLAALVVGLLRSHAEILRALHDLGVNLDDAGSGAPRDFGAVAGRTAPPPGIDEAVRPVEDPAGLGTGSDLMGVTPGGDAVAVGLGRDGLTLLAFLSSGCLTCEEFWTALGRGRGERPAGMDARVVAVTHGPQQESPARVAALAPADVTVVMSSEAYDDYGVPVSPYFVLVDGRDRRIVGEGVARNWEQLESLLVKAAADAGVGLDARRSRRELLRGRQREARVDAELRAAGIGPGHPSLHPEITLPGADEVAGDRAAEDGAVGDGAAGEEAR